MKLVYYGPALSGKTTNLIALHERAGKDSRGRLMTLETKNDRTLFFDLLPLTFRSEGGDVKLRIKLFTVPGQPIHASTRKLVLQGADGVALIADSRVSETENNAASFLDLRDNLKANGSDIAKTPLVIQFNKRDLPSIRTEDELKQMAARGKEPVFTAVAIQGVGVLETFIALLQLTWATLDAAHGLGQKLKVDGRALLATAAQQLNAPSSIEEILNRRLGGHFDPIGVGSSRISGQRSAASPGAPRSQGGP
ncbi:MAG: gliding motility protein [Polyangiaceae bacterium]